MAKRDRRSQIIARVGQLANDVIFGTLSETYRTCGAPGCSCKRGGAKHGPHLQVSYRGESGKTTGYYVPLAAQDDIRAGVAAWKAIQTLLRELSDDNKALIFKRAQEKPTR